MQHNRQIPPTPQPAGAGIPSAGNSGARGNLTGLATRIRRFYEDNPGEELTIEQMLVKWGGTEISLRSALQQVRRMGVELDRVSVYRVRAPR